MAEFWNLIRSTVLMAHCGRLSPEKHAERSVDAYSHRADDYVLPGSGRRRAVANGCVPLNLWDAR
jgi:hypothetical protein